jgi:uncharacterized protein (DUF4213/DUF364 family)
LVNAIDTTSLQAHWDAFFNRLITSVQGNELIDPNKIKTINTASIREFTRSEHSKMVATVSHSDRLPPEYRL